MKSKLRLVPVLLGVMGLMLMALPAAHATTTGGGGVQCTADLPEFPSTGNTGTCDGFAAVALYGVDDDGHTYAVYNDPTVLAGPPPDLANFSATFDYEEVCTANEPLIGTAAGTAEIDDLAGLHDDTPVTATAETDFAWTRVGLTAVVLTNNGSVTMTDGTNTWTASSLDPVPATPPVTSEDTGGAAVAAFAPLNVPDCSNPGPVTAQVVAGAVFGA